MTLNDAVVVLSESSGAPYASSLYEHNAKLSAAERLLVFVFDNRTGFSRCLQAFAFCQLAARGWT